MVQTIAPTSTGHSARFLCPEIPHSLNSMLQEIPHSPPTSSDRPDPPAGLPDPALSEFRTVQKKSGFWHKTEIYTSHGVKYARYRWGNKGTTWGYIHINGGAAADRVVRDRRAVIDRAIAAGAELVEIQQLIAGFAAARAGRKSRDDW